MPKALILNRRDIRNPLGGGAELYTYHLCLALKEIGYDVVWFSSYFKGAKSHEEYDGITILRKGNELTVHFHGLVHALRNEYDLVVDEFNGIGFFTFFMRNSILLIHQLYQEFWTAEMGKPFFFMSYVEKFFLRLYRKKTTITVSPSTKEDLEALGFRNIHIIHNGIDPVEVSCEKERRLTLMYLGRLRRTKNPEDAIRMFLEVKKQVHDAVLWVIGTGPLEAYLRSKYESDEIVFLGYLPEQLKYERLCRGHILLVPSLREGWGIVVIEANMLGIPVIGYDVKGLRDSIKHGYNGFLVKDVHQASETIVRLWRDCKLYENVSRNARIWASQFTWEETRRKFKEFFNGLRVP